MRFSEPSETGSSLPKYLHFPTTSPAWTSKFYRRQENGRRPEALRSRSVRTQTAVRIHCLDNADKFPAEIIFHIYCLKYSSNKISKRDCGDIHAQRPHNSHQAKRRLGGILKSPSPKKRRKDCLRPKKLSGHRANR